MKSFSNNNAPISFQRNCWRYQQRATKRIQNNFLLGWMIFSLESVNVFYLNFSTLPNDHYLCNDYTTLACFQTTKSPWSLQMCSGTCNSFWSFSVLSVVMLKGFQYCNLLFWVLFIPFRLTGEKGYNSYANISAESIRDNIQGYLSCGEKKLGYKLKHSKSLINVCIDD